MPKPDDSEYIYHVVCFPRFGKHPVVKYGPQALYSEPPHDGTLCACGELCKGVCLTAHNENRESQCASACKRLSK